ncbi:unnamed protein product, partial [Mesorhabditis belari]|uniref:Ubiquitin-like domain-containing protein n=1 Tax=Mesorhabditis belari TaxID=2138241 RepID=A0AAF3J6J0_9BILA
MDILCSLVSLENSNPLTIRLENDDSIFELEKKICASFSLKPEEILFITRDGEPFLTANSPTFNDGEKLFVHKKVEGIARFLLANCKRWIKEMSGRTLDHERWFKGVPDGPRQRERIRTAVVQSISSQVQSARRLARDELKSFSTCPLFEENDLPRIEDALFQAHLTSDKSALELISVALRQFVCRAGLTLEFSNVGGKDYAFDNINYFLHNQIPCENVASRFSETKRAQMIPDETYFLAVHLLDKALLVDKNISKMSDVENVMVLAVKLARRGEFGPGYENGMVFGPEYEDGMLAVCNLKLQCQKDKINQCEFKLLKFVDFSISRQHLLHFLQIFWLLMGDVMSGTEKENGWATVKGLAYIATAKASLMNKKPSLVAAAIMRIALHLFFNRGQLPEDEVLQIISSLLHKESEYVPIATKLLKSVLSPPTCIPTIIRVFEANQYHPSKKELEAIACELKK